MAGRGSQLSLKERMNQLELEVKEVRIKLAGALRVIAEKDQEIEELKTKVFKDDTTKLNKRPQITRSLTRDLQRKNDNENDQSIKNEDYFEFPAEHEAIERRLSESVETRIKRALKNTNSSAKKNSEVTEAKSKPTDTFSLEDTFNPVKDLIQKCPLNSDASENSFDITLSNEESLVSRPQENIEGEEDYERLLGQLEEMEKFLGDYGLIWVGDMDFPNEDGTSYSRVQASVGFTPDFDKAIMVICSLNERTASESKVEVSGKLGKFKKADVLKLKIFADGIQLEDNPFREYSSESVREFFKDLDDGYYPTELKETYPDGVIFREGIFPNKLKLARINPVHKKDDKKTVIDKRSQTYAECSDAVAPFAGKGHRLGDKNERQHPIDSSDEMARNKVNLEKETYKEKPMKSDVPMNKESSQDIQQTEIITASSDVVGKGHIIGDKNERQNTIDSANEISKNNVYLEKETYLEKQMKSDMPMNKESTQNIQQTEIITASSDIIKDQEEKGHLKVNVDISQTIPQEIIEPLGRSDVIESENSESGLKSTGIQTEFVKISESTATSSKAVEKKLRTSESQTNLHFDAPINITTITYNEAPVSSEVSGHKVYSQYRKAKGDERIGEESGRRYSTAERDPEMVGSGRGAVSTGRRVDNIQESIASRNTGKIQNLGLTEYSDKIGETARKIEEEIKKKSFPKVTKVPSPNKNFEHITWMNKSPQEIETSDDILEMSRSKIPEDATTELTEEILSGE